MTSITVAPGRLASRPVQSLGESAQAFAPEHRSRPRPQRLATLGRQHETQEAKRHRQRNARTHAGRLRRAAHAAVREKFGVPRLGLPTCTSRDSSSGRCRLRRAPEMRAAGRDDRDTACGGRTRWECRPEKRPKAQGHSLMGSRSATAISPSYQVMSSCTAGLAEAFLMAMIRCAPLSNPVKW